MGEKLLGILKIDRDTKQSFAKVVETEALNVDNIKEFIESEISK